MKKTIVLIDNGHGADTPGKCSPDGTHREWAWSRRMAAELKHRLEERGVEAHLLVPENGDVALQERVRRANEIARRRKALLVSIHNNASGDGTLWHDASGWSAFVAPNASAASRTFASELTKEAVRRGLTGNRRTPPEGYWTAGLAICRDTVCPAVLTENMFQDNRDDVALLASAKGFDAIASLHTEVICRSISKL